MGRLPPPVGGVTIFVSRKIAQLRQAGNAVDVLEPGISYRVLISLVKLVFGRYDEVILSSFNAVAVMMLLSSLQARKVVIYDHNHSRRLKGYSRPRRWIVLLLISLCRRLVLVGGHLKEHYSAEFLARIPHTIESPFIPPDRASELAIRNSYPPEVEAFITQHSPTLLIAATRIRSSEDRELYGVDHVLDMLEGLKRTARRLGAIIAVGSDEGVGALRVDVEQRSLAGDVLILSGGREIWPLFLDIDLFVRPTSTDGDSISLREALHLGCTVVASDRAPRPDGAIVYRTGEPTALLAAVTGALDSLLGPDWREGVASG